MDEQSSLSSSHSNHLVGPSAGRATASCGLEHDNSTLRQKLHELRDEKSRLISENHGLVSEVEKVRFELHCTVGKVKSLQESAENQQLREEELRRSLVEATTKGEERESERREWENQYRSCSLQLTESNSLIQRQTEMLLSLKQELTDLSASKKDAEANRDTALSGAEQMRQSFVDFQDRLQSRLRSAEDRLSSSYDEREKLLADLVRRCMEIEGFQNVQEQLRAEVATERSLRQSAETQNSELVARLRDYAPQVEKMEAEMRCCEQLRNENHELRTSLEEKSRKVESCEVELAESRKQLEDLESLAQTLQGNIVASLKSCERSREVAAQRDVFECLEEGRVGQLENATVVEELRSRLALAEKELQQLRRKNANENNNDGCGCPALSTGGLCEKDDAEGAFRFDGTVSIDNWEASLQKLEEDRQLQAATISTLERKLADLEVVKVSLGAQLMQRNSQIDDLQRDMHDQSVRAATTERALRRATLQTAALDRQLDERSSQVTTLVSKVDDLEERLRTKSDELEKLDRRVEEAVGSGETARQMGERRCRELKEQLDSAESRHRVTMHQLEQTERRSMSLQQTLNEMNVTMNALRQELQQSANQLNEQKAQSDRKIHQLDSIHHQQREALKEAATKLQAAEEQHHVEFSSMAKRVSDLEEELRKATEVAEERNDRLELLEEELKEREAALREGSTRLEELEGLQNALRREKEEREQALCEELSGLRVRLEGSEKKLNVATTDIERREQQARELAQTIRDLQLEKKRIIDELGNELKDTLKQLKNERRGNERMSADMVSLQAETRRLAELVKDKEELAENLQEQLGLRDAELVETSQAAKDLFAECERRKLESETKDVRLTELESRLRGRETELEECRCQLETERQEMRRCRDELRSRQDVVEELSQELEQRRWDVQQRAARVTQLDMAMKERLAESEQRVARLESALQKTQLEVHQKGKQSGDLTEQAKGLMAALRQKSHLVHELEQVVRQLKTELDSEKERALAQSTQIEAMCLERDGLVLSKRRSQDELTKTSDQLEALQERLGKCEQRLAATEAEFDRATESLADARCSFQSQKSELEKLLEALAKADEDRARLGEHLKRSETEYRQANDQLARELAQMKDSHVVARSSLEEELATEQRKLRAAEETHRQLMQELRRAGQQASSLQMELDATRMIASATRETSLIKDGEIARLKARISSISRSQLTAAMETGCFVADPGPVEGEGCDRADFDSTAGVFISGDCVQGQRRIDEPFTSLNDDVAVAARNLSLSSLSTVGNSTQVGGGKFPASSGKRSESLGWVNGATSSADSQPFKERSISDEQIPCASRAPPGLDLYPTVDDDNPDSLQTMWNQLQQGRTNSLPACRARTDHDSDREVLQKRNPCRAAAFGGATTATGISDPRRCAAAAPCSDPVRGGCHEEKLRVQNRIKALIGYKEPPSRKTSSKSSMSSDSLKSSSTTTSSRSRVVGHQQLNGGNSRSSNSVLTAASQSGTSRDSVKRRVQNGSQVELAEESDCSSSTT